ncbi:MAG: hypothetical protein KGJ60_01210 [Verrucomicrobiota bacterium]|nr:hypothetical protein [Verrucomicrobiota bacterium]MDE3066148.1 hypothetical protein [Verrucomicrobiota bacterium]
MKRTIALLLAVGALALTGCSVTQDGAKSETQKSAIESVFAQRARLEAENGPAGLVSKQGLPRLMAIDVRNCPADFRSAWFDYLVQVQNLHTRAERVAMFATAAGKPATDAPSLVKFAVTNPRLGEYLLGALGRSDEAWNKLERTAMNYGVLPER